MFLPNVTLVGAPMGRGEEWLVLTVVWTPHKTHTYTYFDFMANFIDNTPPSDKLVDAHSSERGNCCQVVLS